MSNARNLGELLEADGEVPSGKIDEQKTPTTVTGTPWQEVAIEV